MDLELTDEQKILQDSVANFCKAHLDSESLRALADEPKGVSDDLWRKISEQGWIGCVFPEDDGGLGLGYTELGIICEEMGRVITPGPFFSTAVLGGPAIAFGATAAAKEKHLEKIAMGESVATLALFEEGGELGAAHVQATAEKKGEGYVLNGKKFFVSDLIAADLIVVAARTSGGEDGTTLFIVEAGASGVTKEANKLWDSTSRSGQLILDNVEVGADAVVGNPGAGWALVEKILLGANVCVAGESVAASEQVFRTTIDYVKERTQFGRAIGSFQAVQHPLANLFADLESARSAYHYAAWAVDVDSGDKKSAVAVARVVCTASYKDCCLTCLQAQGGIAFTWEYDLHLYLKRAKHNEFFLGIPHDYEEAIAVEGLKI